MPHSYLSIITHKQFQVEEVQFQQYAKKTISEAKDRGAPLKLLVAAAKGGAGMLATITIVIF